MPLHAPPEIRGTTPNMILDQGHDTKLRLPGNVGAASTQAPTDAGIRQYLVLKRRGRWCIKSLGRFSAPYSSEATAIGAAIDRAELAGSDGRRAVVKLFTRAHGFTTIRIIGGPCHAAA
ncbi:MAG: hypothetical protein PSV22_11645 [Pseudolabrys sp.]|nr:hypothetical protein [Pseudolabrys sp.]